MPLSRSPNPLLTGTQHRLAMLQGNGTSPRLRASGKGLRVLIVHADASCREDVAGLLRRSDIEVVDVVPDCEAAIGAAKEASPDLVLIGAGGQPPSACETTRRLAYEVPGSRVLIFGDADAEQELAGTLVAGAAGFVRVDGRAERLDVTVRIAIALIAYREVAEYEGRDA